MTVQDPTTLTSNVTILSNGGTGSATGAGGAVAFTAAGSATVNSDATPRSLTINAGTANVTFGAAVGNSAGLASLAVTGGTTILTGNVTTADVAANNVTLTSNVTLNSNTWTVYVGNNGSNAVYSFVRTSNETSGTVNILGLLKWLENTKGYFSNPTLSTIQYGFEISGTGGTQQNFTINSYSASAS